MDSGRPLDIRQGSSVVIITPETTSSPRYLYLRAKHVDADLFDPATNGDSIATWQGDTLVVQTAGFNEKTFLDATGAPHTDELVTTERIRKISPTQLEIIVNVHDPDYYTRDWQARFVYTLRSDVRIEDYVCGEPHRDISSVAGVRRP
jgi:hypothetical protein